jgi:hypothetical protein
MDIVGKAADLFYRTSTRFSSKDAMTVKKDTYWKRKYRYMY